MRKIYFFLLAAFSFTSKFTIAQNTSPYWNLAGNSTATTSSKLGTTNNIPLRLFTNNVERLRIDGTGKIGIGTLVPKGLLSIQSSGSTPASIWISSGVPILAGLGENTPGNADQILGMASNNASARAVFLGRKSRGTLSLPTAVQADDYLLSLYSSGYDGGGSFQAPATVDFIVDGTVSSGHVPTRISLSTGSGFSDRVERLKVGSTGDININNGQLFVHQSDGNVGVGNSTPGSYKLHINHGSYGLLLDNGSSNWEMVTYTSLYLYKNNNLRGNFDATTGAYSSLSDARLKKNIRPMDTILNKIGQLKPSSYQFLNAKDTQRYNGFLAQDVIKVFPSLVTHNVNPDRQLDVYTMDYSGFGVLAIKAIQELTPVIQEQKKEMEQQKKTILSLEQRIATLESVLAELGKNNGSTVSSVSGTIQQNYPNPVNGQTVIPYTVPLTAKSAQLVVVDAKGQTVKAIVVSGRGVGQLTLDTGVLATGTYTYSLIVDHQRVDSRQLIIAR